VRWIKKKLTSRTRYNVSTRGLKVIKTDTIKTNSTLQYDTFKQNYIVFCLFFFSIAWWWIKLLKYAEPWHLTVNNYRQERKRPCNEPRQMGLLSAAVAGKLLTACCQSRHFSGNGRLRSPWGWVMAETEIGTEASRRYRNHMLGQFRRRNRNRNRTSAGL